MICELCGRETDNFEYVIVDGAVLTVCPSCAKFGRKVKGMKARGINLSALSAGKGGDELPEPDTILVEDYAERIRNARMKMGMTQEQLAKKLMEKESVIAKIERGDMRPSDKLARKLEKTLGIKLFERLDEIEGG